MNDIHYLTTVTQTSRYVGLKCPVRKTPFKLGQTIIVCQESDVAFSLEGWNYLKTTTCPYCEQNVFLPSKKDEKQRYYPVPKSVLIKWFVLGSSVTMFCGIIFFIIWSKTSNLTAIAPPPTYISTSASPRVIVFPETPTFKVSTQIPSLTLDPEPNSQTSNIDGMMQVYVPAGKFLMGASPDDSMAGKDEKPQHTVYLDDYFIDLTEVTNEMFAFFIEKTGYVTTAERDGWSWDYDGTNWQKTRGADWRHPKGPNSDFQGRLKFPVVRVSWDDALEYCKWAGRRLPTEAEWEKAARGTNGALYPWGSASPTSHLLNFNQNVGDAVSVGLYPDGASPYGALDMAGNVWEWIADWYDESYYSHSSDDNPGGPSTGLGRGMRGGSWIWGARQNRGSWREWGYQDNSYWSTGFRCAIGAQ